MPADGEIVKDAVGQFRKIQAHMKNAKEDNVTKSKSNKKQGVSL